MTITEWTTVGSVATLFIGTMASIWFKFRKDRRETEAAKPALESKSKISQTTLTIKPDGDQLHIPEKFRYKKTPPGEGGLSP